MALVWLAMAVVWGTGCSPDTFLATDEEREGNLQRAFESMRLKDFEGAAIHFERALERNPRSALAHLGYASLCESHLRRYPEAVYHYQRFLRLRPNDPKAEDIGRRIKHSTELLAQTVPMVVRSESIARDLEAMRRENLALRAQVTQLTSISLQWSNEVQRLTHIAAQSLSPPPRPGETAITPLPRYAGSSGAAAATGTGATAPVPRSLAGAGSHVVQSGDTLHRIALRYGVSLAELRAANPGVRERQLRPGTRLRIPASRSGR
jgi:LysM repeat protein